VLPEDQWWFNLVTQKVEQGLGAPNVERLGPYDTEAEAAGVLERMHARNEAWDREEHDSYAAQDEDED
jgi:hypothetical protein